MSNYTTGSFEDGFNLNEKKRKMNNSDDDSQTQDYYENESLRMEVLFNFVQKKFPVKESFSQTSRLIKLAEKERDELMREISNLCLLENSEFKKNIEKIFAKGLN